MLTVIGDRIFTAAELWAAMDDRAHEFVAAGLRRGDRLCVLQDNSSELILDLLGAMRLGVVVAPVNTALRGDSLASVIADLAPCIVRTDADHYDQARLAGAGLDRVSVWCVGESNSSTFACGRDAPGRTDDSRVDEGRSGASGDDSRADESQMNERDLAVILLTSGTTGMPKGVMWPHAMALGVAEHTTWVMGYDDEDTIYTCLPLFHINALFCALYAGLLVGAHVVVARRFSLSSFWGDVSEHAVTATNMMGAMPALL